MLRALMVVGPPIEQAATGFSACYRRTSLGPVGLAYASLASRPSKRASTPRTTASARSAAVRVKARKSTEASSFAASLSERTTTHGTPQREHT